MKDKKAAFLSIWLVFIFLSISCKSQEIIEGNTMTNPETYKINIFTGDSVISAVIYDNPAARDFISLLPLQLELEDYAGIEKVSGLPKKLSTRDAASGFDPSPGDITYYAPWGNLAVFYKDFRYASGLVSLGKIEKGLELLNVAEPLKVIIELDK